MTCSLSEPERAETQEARRQEKARGDLPQQDKLHLGGPGEPGYPASGPRKIWNVFFIDDDRDFLDAQTLFFASRGHRVRTAESSREALALLEGLAEERSNRPDIIFLDLMLEHTDSGFRLAHAIRHREELAGVPIVMLSSVARETGYRFDHEGQKLLTWSRLDRFLDKPVTGRQLLAVAEELLG